LDEQRDAPAAPQGEAQERAGFAATARSCRLDAVIPRRCGDGDHDRQLPHDAWLAVPASGF
jgi:hypothetical protein